MQPLLHRAFGVYALDGFQMERIRHQSKALVKSKQESTISRVVVHNVGGKYGHEHAGSDRSQQDYRQSDPLPTGRHNCSLPTPAGVQGAGRRGTGSTPVGWGSPVIGRWRCGG
jgi:hypothetical protein